jgi:glycerol dehydrogenase
LLQKRFGKKCTFIGGKKSLSIVEEPLKKSLLGQGVSLEQSLWCGGEASKINIDSLVV